MPRIYTFKRRGTDENEEKWCNRCKRWRLLNTFSRDSSKKGGLHSFCKECQVLRYRDWAKRNPEKYTALMRKRTAKIQAAENILPLLLLCMIKHTLGGENENSTC